MESKFYNIKEFADAAAVAVVTVRGWIASGKIQAEKRIYKGFRARWYINADELKKITPIGEKHHK